MKAAITAACAVAAACGLAAPAVALPDGPQILAVKVVQHPRPILPASPARIFLYIDNPSTTATLACAFDRRPELFAAGSFTIFPGASRSWQGPGTPLGTLTCLSSEPSSPATVEVY